MKEFLKEMRNLLTDTFASCFRVDESFDFEGIFLIENTIKGGIFHFTTTSFEEETLRRAIIHGFVEPVMDHYVHYVYHYPADRHSNLAKLR